MESERRRAGAGEIKPTTYKAKAERIEHFRHFCGDQPIQNLDEQGAKLLDTFRGAILKSIIDGNITQQTGKNQLSEAKAFVQWAYRREIIHDRPRNFDALQIRVDRQPIVIFSQKELDAVLSNASLRVRLYLMLMLNCGMYQSDISELRQTEVDWKAGRITRKRTKTERQESVPVVSWLLWDRTLELLSAHRSDDPIRVLVNENGTALRRSVLTESGKVREVDNVKSGYDRLCKKLKRDTGEMPKPMKFLRKTAASKLGESAEFGRYAQHFLDQAPDNLADERYVRPDKATFDRAVVWLGEQFGFSTDPKRLGG